jgi:hypothetical protein
MKNPKALLANILSLKKSFEYETGKAPPALTGWYGEILAFEKLSKEIGSRFNVNLLSGQKDADIELIDKNTGKPLKIEVKTSLRKEEGHGCWFGAALNVKKCKIHNEVHDHFRRGPVHGDFCYFNYLVFVAMENDFSNERFYVIPRNFIEENKQELRNTHSRFANATHRIVISAQKEQLTKLNTPQLEAIAKTEQFLNRWDLIE